MIEIDPRELTACEVEQNRQLERNRLRWDRQHQLLEGGTVRFTSEWHRQWWGETTPTPG